MFKSAIVTLTLWYVLLSVGLSLLFSGVLYHASTHELGDALRNQYQEIANNDHDGDNQRYVSTELDARSQHLLRQLVYFNIVILAGSGIVSYLLARRTLKPIEDAHKAQVRFTAEASHELRTPLTAMKADTEATLMDRSNDPAVLRKTLQDNLRDIEKLEKLANHLLEISRHKSKAVTAFEDIDLETVIQKALEQLQQPIHANQLKIRASTASVHVKGDPQGLQQLFIIVLDNAIKYSHSKGSIDVKLANDNKHAVIVITDEGIGIRAADLPHIFERFYRSKTAVAKEGEVSGYGLGLPLAKEIVDLHKGSFEIQSEENKGTTATIELPLS